MFQTSCLAGQDVGNAPDRAECLRQTKKLWRVWETVGWQRFAFRGSKTCGVAYPRKTPLWRLFDLANPPLGTLLMGRNASQRMNTLPLLQLRGLIVCLAFSCIGMPASLGAQHRVRSRSVTDAMNIACKRPGQNRWIWSLLAYVCPAGSLTTS